MLNKAIYIIILLFSTGVNAQLNMQAVTGGMKMSDNNIGSFNYFIIDSSKCISFRNGLSLLPIKAAVLLTFSPFCKVEQVVVEGCPLQGYPNPTTGLTVIKSPDCFSSSSFSKGVLTVFNAQGQLIISRDIFYNDLIAGSKVNLTGYSAGFYYINIYFLNYSQSIKIIKSNG